jgi:hypothetical protein
MTGRQSLSDLLSAVWQRTLVDGPATTLEVDFVPEHSLERAVLLGPHREDVAALDELVEDLLRAAPRLLERPDGDAPTFVLRRLDGREQLGRCADVVVGLSRTRGRSRSAPATREAVRPRLVAPHLVAEEPGSRVPDDALMPLEHLLEADIPAEVLPVGHDGDVLCSGRQSLAILKKATRAKPSASEDERAGAREAPVAP